MRLLLTAALLATLATSASAADAKQTPGNGHEGFAKAEEGFFAAWNVHDVKAMASFWTDDATLINPMGRRAHGRAEIEKLLADEQTTVFKSSTAKVDGFEVTRSLGPNLVFCDGNLTVDGAVGPDGSAVPQMNIHLAVVLEKQGDRWMLAEARPYAFTQPPPQSAKMN